MEDNDQEALEVTVKHVNCIVDFSFEMDRPGVYVARGRNGAGKSTLIACVTAIGEQDRGGLAVREGAEKGLIRGMGQLLEFGKRTKKEGLKSVDFIGSASIAKFVDPGLKEPEKINAARVKELVRLRGAEISEAEFKAHLAKQGIIDPAITIAAAGITDPLAAVTAIKKALETKARLYESDADELQGALRVLTDQCESVGPELDVNETKEALQAAIREKDALERKAVEAAESAEKIEEAKRQLVCVMAESEEDKNLDDEFVRAEKQVTFYANQLAHFQSLLENEEARVSLLRGNITIRNRNRERSAELQKVIEATAIKAPTTAELNDAANKVTLASRKNAEAENQEVIKAKIEEIDVKTAKLATTKERSNKYREAAQSIQSILSTKIGSTRFSLVDGVLVWNGDDRRKPEPYDRLSDGFKWRVAFEEIADINSDSKAIITIEQPAWEGLDLRNRCLVAEMAHDSGVYLVTGAHDEGDLRVEYFDWKAQAV